MSRPILQQRRGSHDRKSNTLSPSEAGSAWFVRIADCNPRLMQSHSKQYADDQISRDNLFRVGGRGILLMRSFMTAVQFSDRGSRVTLVKRRAT